MSVDSFSAEIQEFQQRSCLAPYHFYGKNLNSQKSGYTWQISHKSPDTGHKQLKYREVTVEMLY